MTAPTMQSLVLARREDDSTGLRVDDVTTSWADLVASSRHRARWMAGLAAGDKAVPHVGVLMHNGPEYVQLLVGAALSGAVVVGLNPTRTGLQLQRDTEHTACDVVVTDAAHRPVVGDAGVSVPILQAGTEEWREVLASAGQAVEHPGADPADPTAPYVLILTSGTTSAPKAVVCSTGKIASQGSVIPHLVGLTSEDTTYLAMPLFHSNAVIAGFAPTLAVGATMALAPKFSASSFLDDVRRYGATYANYVGQPLSYVLAQPARPDDADNPLRVLFGNEAAPADIRRFAERFDCKVIDAYGSTEGGIAILRTDETPPDALGVGIGDIAVLDPMGKECPVAKIDEDGTLLNAGEAVGELVNRDGAGAFEGYWNNDEAVAERLADGYYHSGDLGYRDADGFLYFAGRMGDWLRVGGENFAVAPVQRVLVRHPHVIEAVVVGVPDAVAGDQVLAVLVVDGRVTADEFASWMAGQPDLPVRWRPRYVRFVADLPRTGTGKIRRGEVAAAAWHPAGTMVAEGSSYRLLTTEDRATLRAAFASAGRARLHPDPAPAPESAPEPSESS